MQHLRPSITENPTLVMQAERHIPGADGRLFVEVEQIQRHVKAEVAPLALLYDIRTHVDLAHAPNAAEAGGRKA
jgi:hypothetical protein